MKGWRVLDIATRKVIVSRNIWFNEIRFPFVDVSRPSLIMMRFGTWPKPVLDESVNVDSYDPVSVLPVVDSVRNGGPPVVSSSSNQPHEDVLPSREDPTPREDVLRPREDVSLPREDVLRPRDDVSPPREDVSPPHDTVPTPIGDVLQPCDTVSPSTKQNHDAISPITDVKEDNLSPFDRNELWDTWPTEAKEEPLPLELHLTSTHRRSSVKRQGRTGMQSRIILF